jgi:predicted alpha/beta-fold hydrolase
MADDSTGNPEGGPATMGSLLGSRDAECFVGRERELALVSAALDDDTGTAPRILLVHGPGGIGKNSLLREIGQRGQAAGWDVVRIDGRDLDHAPGAAAAAFAPP